MITGKNWMGSLSDDTLITNITIPGTHYSCSYQSDSKYSQIDSVFVQTQKFDITKQLEMGCRFFDIRLKLVDGVLKLFHGDYYLLVDFKDVMSEFEKFLDSNAGEVLFVSIKSEGGEDISSVFISGFYKNNDYWCRDPWVKFLSHCRGKMILLNRRSSRGSVYVGFGIRIGNNMSSWSDISYSEFDPSRSLIITVTGGCLLRWLFYENRYTTKTLQEKIDVIHDNLNKKANDKNYSGQYLYISFTSGVNISVGAAIQETPISGDIYSWFSDGEELFTPLGLSHVINPWLYNTWASAADALGIIAMDFVNPALVQKLIQTNPGIPKTSVQWGEQKSLNHIIRGPNPSMQGASSPGVITYNGKPYLFWNGSGHDGIWYSESNNHGQTWETQQSVRSQLPDRAMGVYTNTSPATTILNGELYLFWVGSGDDGIFYTKFNGSYWATQQRVNINLGVKTGSSPCAVTYNGKIHLFWSGAGNDGIFCSTYSEQTGWSDQFGINYGRLGLYGESSPAAVVNNNKLYLFWSGAGKDGIWYCTCNGGQWSDQISIKSQEPFGEMGVCDHSSPAVTVMKGSVFVFWNGSGGADLWSIRLNENGVQPGQEPVLPGLMGMANRTSPAVTNIDIDGTCSPLLFWNGVGGDFVYMSKGTLES